MASMILIGVESPPDTIRVLVDFYDEIEKAALLKSSMQPVLAKLPQVMDIPTPDFCTYYLYHKKRPGVPRYSTHNEVGRQWNKALVDLEGQVNFKNSSIGFDPRVELDTGTRERIGEAIGLSVA